MTSPVKVSCWCHLATMLMLHKTIPILTSQGLSTCFRDPGKPAWAEHFSRGGRMTPSASHSSCLVFTNALNRVLTFMRFWKADPHSGNCKGCWEAASQSCCLFHAQWMWWVRSSSTQIWRAHSWLMTPVSKGVQLRLDCQGLWNRVLRPWLVRMNKCKSAKQTAGTLICQQAKSGMRMVKKEIICNYHSLSITLSGLGFRALGVARRPGILATLWDEF